MAEGEEILEGVDASVSTVRGTVRSSWQLTNGRVCGSAAERGMVELSCMTPNDKIETVNFASFGTPTGNCGNFSTAADCNSNRSLEVIKKACIGEHSCQVWANASLFGRMSCPPHTHKFLDVEVTCSISQPLQMQVEVPVGSHAQLLLPLVHGITNATATVTEGSHTIWDKGQFVPGDPGVGRAHSLSSTSIAFELGSGSFTFYLAGP